MAFKMNKTFGNMFVTGLIRIGLPVLVICLATASAGRASDEAKAQLIVDNAMIAIDEFRQDPDMEWLNNNIDTAKGLLIVPELLKGGFFLGGSGGHCIFLSRENGSGRWRNPVFYTMGSVSFGLQIGAKKSQVIIMVRTQNGLDRLFASSVKLGGDVSVAAGPKGSGVGSDVLTDYISFARSKGAFMGVSLEGAVIRINEKMNTAYYGKPVRPVDIIAKETVQNPDALPLRRKVAAWAKQSD